MSKDMYIYIGRWCFFCFFGGWGWWEMLGMLWIRVLFWIVTLIFWFSDFVFFFVFFFFFWVWSWWGMLGMFWIRVLNFWIDFLIYLFIYLFIFLIQFDHQLPIWFRNEFCRFRIFHKFPFSKKKSNKLFPIFGKSINWFYVGCFFFAKFVFLYSDFFFVKFVFLYSWLFFPKFVSFIFYNFIFWFFFLRNSFFLYFIILYSDFFFWFRERGALESEGVFRISPAAVEIREAYFQFADGERTQFFDKFDKFRFPKTNPNPFIIIYYYPKISERRKTSLREYRIDRNINRLCRLTAKNVH